MGEHLGTWRKKGRVGGESDDSTPSGTHLKKKKKSELGLYRGGPYKKKARLPSSGKFLANRLENGKGLHHGE